MPSADPPGSAARWRRSDRPEVAWRVSIPLVGILAERGAARQFMRHPCPGRLADACAVVRKFRQIRTTDRTLTMKKPRPRKKSDSESFAEGVGRGLRMAARRARRIARMYGTPIYVCENGKVVAKK